jgi:3-phenylpropionate/trans-cinnamate dioxygenase ferredoxin reductase subunit
MPYDRPPLSKSVLTGWLAAENTDLPRWETVEGVDWRLGVAATGLDLRAKRVHLADGRNAEYDRLMIATGTRARPWTNPAEAVLDGVFTVRTRSDAARLHGVDLRCGMTVTSRRAMTEDACAARAFPTVMQLTPRWR